ncbi:uncharacterized protein YifN (PemK superfamily) [Paraburkholderia sp. GAS41]|jgi:uncharacterized protein YifN (PemK superfamily)|uniref:hypothetical protein n=1 Tax=Paraburkholderia sp. GAS41 TaxID=3035134 RepID=UPI003D1A34E4
MIVVNYEEQVTNPATGAVEHQALGSETHTQITEVLLPFTPTPADPIFMTKKFSGRDEYRWEVLGIGQDYTQPQRTYVVTLLRREPVKKNYYLSAILAAKKATPKKVIFRNAIVEVEYGHAMNIGDEAGGVESNKRYVDTVQRGSMPKRRLAIVNQVLERKEQDLIQVIPISSRKPVDNESSLRMVDVTACLSNLIHYQKPSWAICEMMETVAPSRIMAPMRRKFTGANGQAVDQRDLAFATKITSSIRQELDDAMMYAVHQKFRIETALNLQETKESTKALQVQVDQLSDKVTALEADLASIAASLNMTVGELLAEVAR